MGLQLLSGEQHWPLLAAIALISVMSKSRRLLNPSVDNEVRTLCISRKRSPRVVRSKQQVGVDLEIDRKKQAYNSLCVDWSPNVGENGFRGRFALSSWRCLGANSQSFFLYLGQPQMFPVQISISGFQASSASVNVGGMVFELKKGSWWAYLWGEIVCLATMDVIPVQINMSGFKAKGILLLWGLGRRYQGFN